MMTAVQASKLYDALSKSTAHFSTIATQLSDRIQKLEESLNRLPGKVSAGIKLGDSTTLLVFARHGSVWRLLLTDKFHSKDGTRTLSDGRVEDKLQAIEQFPELLDALLKETQRQTELTTKALKQVESFAFSAQAEGKEGV